MTYAVVSVGSVKPIKGRNMPKDSAINLARALSADFWGLFAVVDETTATELCCYKDSRRYRCARTAAGGDLKTYNAEKVRAEMAELLA